MRFKPVETDDNRISYLSYKANTNTTVHSQSHQLLFKMSINSN